MAEPDQKIASCGSNDTVSLRNLRLNHGIIAPIWGTPKEQPALISVDLVLRNGFESAAGKDALDDNTVHYGILAKSIRGAAGGKNQPLDAFHAMLENVVTDLAMTPNGSCKVSHATFTFTFPKATSFGQSLDIVTTIAYDRGSKPTVVHRGLKLKEMRLMVLIGVNDDERLQKQPVIVEFELLLGKDADENVSSLCNELFRVEANLAKIIQATDFETLEALANYTVSRLKHEILSKIPSSRYLRLSLAKPLAVRHADASSVTVFRTLSEGHEASEDGPSEIAGTEKSESSSTLRIIKPYL